MRVSVVRVHQRQLRHSRLSFSSIGRASQKNRNFNFRIMPIHIVGYQDSSFYYICKRWKFVFRVLDFRHSFQEQKTTQQREIKHMTYKFICPKCGKKHEISMRISEYTAKGHKCDCGEELVRDPEGFSCNFVVKCDGFYGKSNSNWFQSKPYRHTSLFFFHVFTSYIAYRSFLVYLLSFSCRLKPSAKLIRKGLCSLYRPVWWNW